jgi:hypothetical protein
MPRMLVTPLARISLMMGRTLAANASASSLRPLREARRAARAFHRLDIGQAFQV